MKYRHARLAAVLAGVALSASAQDIDVIVEPEEACPPRTASTLPFYT